MLRRSHEGVAVPVGYRLPFSIGSSHPVSWAMRWVHVAQLTVGLGPEQTDDRSSETLRKRAHHVLVSREWRILGRKARRQPFRNCIHDYLGAKYLELVWNYVCSVIKRKSHPSVNPMIDVLLLYPPPPPTPHGTPTPYTPTKLQYHAAQQWFLYSPRLTVAVCLCGRTIPIFFINIYFTHVLRPFFFIKYKKYVSCEYHSGRECKYRWIFMF